MTTPALPCHASASLSRRRALGYFGLGLAAAWWPRFAGSSGASPRIWVADRGADRVHGLDGGLVLRASLTVDAPTALERRSDGGLWVLSALAALPIGPHRLLALAPGGALQAAADFGPCVALAALAGDAALLVEGGLGAVGRDRLWRVDASGRRTLVFEAPGLTCVAAAGTEILVGGQSGEVWRFDAADRHPLPPRGLSALGGQIGHVAPGPRRGTWWALDVSGPGRVLQLDDELLPRWERTSGLSVRHLVAVPGEERVWLADTDEPRVRRYGPGGQLELDLGRLPLAGLDRGLAPWPYGSRDGVLLVAPGAVLHLDGRGRLGPGQGGFQFLVDLA